MSGTGVGARDGKMMQMVHGPNASQRNSQNSGEDFHLSLPQLLLRNPPGVTSASDLKFCLVPPSHSSLAPLMLSCFSP